MFEAQVNIRQQHQSKDRPGCRNESTNLHCDPIDALENDFSDMDFIFFVYIYLAKNVFFVFSIDLVAYFEVLHEEKMNIFLLF